MAESKDNESKHVTKVKLHEADEPWKPSFKQKQIPSVNEIQRLEKQILITLNKISPQKYQVHLKWLLKLDINTKKELDTILHLIYERATIDSLYSIVYAQLYKDLLMDKKAAFNLSEDEVEKKIQFYYQLGNMKFIGELFKMNIISATYIDFFVNQLLTINSEKSLQSLCQLLNTVGKELEQNQVAESKKFLDIYFTKIEEILNSKSTSTRIRFLLEDVKELRKNNWTPRRIENCPRTIDEIHLEVVQEAIECGLSFQSRVPKKSEFTSTRTNSEDEQTTKIKIFIEDFLHNPNFELGKASVTDFISSMTFNKFMKVVILLVLGKSNQDRLLVGQLFHYLVQQKTISFEQYKKGFAFALELAKELPSNVLIVWNNILEIIQPIINENFFTLASLEDILKPIIPSKSAGNIISIILHYLTKEKGNLAVKQLWEKSGLNLTTILGSNINTEEFIHEHKLELIIDNPKRTLNTVVPSEK